MRRPDQRRRLRWLVMHEWLGLGAGLLFVLLGLTGSVLVFYLGVDEWLNPPLAWRESDGEVRAFQPVLEAIQRAHPQRTGSWRLELPPGGRGLVTARYLKPHETHGAAFAPLLVTVHPATLEVRASRFWGSFAATWLYDLHYTLLAGDAGRWVVGGVGVLLVGSLASGVVLWWPSARQRRAAFRFKRGAAPQRRTFDLHKLAGIYGLAVLGTLAVTGTVLALPEVVEPAVAWISPPLTVTPPRSAEPLPGRLPITLDAALRSAQDHFPAATARWVDTPAGPDGAFRVRMRQPGEPSRRFPRTLVWVDGYSAQVLAVRDAKAQGAGDTVLAWMHPLHNGEAFGMAGRVIACLGGLLPLWLAVTGLMRWRDRRVARRAAISRATSAPT